MRIQIPDKATYIDFPEGMSMEAMQKAIKDNWDSIETPLAKSHGPVVTQPTQEEEIRAVEDLMGIPTRKPVLKTTPAPSSESQMISTLKPEAKRQPMPTLEELGMTEAENAIAATGGYPYQEHDPYSTAEVLHRTIGQAKEVGEAAMMVPIGLGLATHPLSTIAALGVFTGLSELTNLAVSTAKKQPYAFQGGQGIAELFEAEKLSKDAIDLGQFIGEALLTGGLLKGGRIAFQKFGEIARGIKDKQQKIDFINDVAKDVKEQGVSPDEAVQEKIKPAWSMTKEEYGKMEAPVRENGGKTSLVLPDGTAVVGGNIHGQTYDMALRVGVTEEALANSKAGFTKEDGTTWFINGDRAEAKKVLDLGDVLHEREVIKAISEGKPVPVEVLKDYPELFSQPKTEPTPKTKASKKRTIADKSLLAIVRENGGLDPEKMRAAGVDIKGDILENKLFGTMKKGGQGIDELATELIGRGIIEDTPEGLSPGTHLLNLLKQERQGRAATIKNIEKMADRDLADLEEQYGKDLIEARRREIEEGFEKEIAGKTPEELAREAQDLVDKFPEDFVTEKIIEVNLSNSNIERLTQPVTLYRTGEKTISDQWEFGTRGTFFGGSPEVSKIYGKDVKSHKITQPLRPLIIATDENVSLISNNIAVSDLITVTFPDGTKIPVGEVGKYARQRGYDTIIEGGWESINKGDLSNANYFILDIGLGKVKGFLAPEPTEGPELFDTRKMWDLKGQEGKGTTFVPPEAKQADKLFDTEKATTDELYERTKRKPSEYADIGGYARGETSPTIVEMPELVEIAKGLGQGVYPQIKKILSIRKALGLFRSEGRGKIELEAGAFRDPEVAAKTLAHEIGHWVDYLPEQTMGRGNILGRIASLKKYTEKLLPEKPGAEGILTKEDRIRFREEAKRQLEAERPDHDIVEEITREVPIYREVGVTRDMIMGIMQGRTEREKFPELYKWLAQQSAATKKEIVKKAIKDVIDERLARFGAREQIGTETITETITRLRNTKPPTQAEIEARLNKMWRDEINRRKLYEQEVITEELKNLTQQWKPFDVDMDKRFTAYRHSSKELYADALSVLMNNPEMLKRVAPTFHKAFFNYMESKPEVMDIYNTILERQRDIRAVLETRDQNIEAMFDKGEVARKEAAMERNRFDLRDAVDALNKEMNDVNYKVIQKVNALGKRGIGLLPEDNPKYWLEELPYVSSEVSAYLRDINNTILKPAKAEGIAQRDISKYLYFRRVMTERSELANPLGHTPKTAQDALSMMKGRLGEELYAKVEGYGRRFNEARQSVIEKLDESGMLSDELMTKIKDNENYVTFNVQKYMDEAYGKGTTARIYKQIGTLNEIRDPLTATVMKDAALFRAAHRNITAEKIGSMMRSFFPDEFQVAERRFNGKALIPVEPKDPKMGLVTFMKKGKMEGYYAPKDIAETLDRDPYQAGILVRMLQIISRPLKEIFVSKNPFWMAWNLQRDVRALATNLPEANLLKAIKYGARAIPDAYKDVFKNISTADVEQMYRNKELIVGRTYGGKQLTTDAELDRMLLSFGEEPVQYNSKVLQVLSRFWEALDKPGQFSERLTKIAGHKLLMEAGTRDPKELAHIVRTRVGSPDFKRAGHLVQLYNNLWLFSNAGKEGIKASWESYKEDKASFLWKTAKYDMLPKMAQYAAGLGLFGFGIKKLMDNISENDKRNYITVPFGQTENGKTAYFVIPQSFSGQTVTGVMWSMLNAGKQKDISQLFDYMSGQIPYSGLNPIIGVAMDTVQYLSGKNPYDSWRGKPAIPEQRFEAGGKWAAESMAKYVANQLGASAILYRFDNDGLNKVKGELEQAIGIPIVGRAIERFIRVSNVGKVQQLKEIAQDIRQQRAEENLTVQDKIIDHINEVKTPSMADAKGLYESLVMNGTIKRMDRGTFDNHYKDLLVFRHNSPYANAIVGARTREEKIAIINKAVQDKAFKGGQ